MANPADYLLIAFVTAAQAAQANGVEVPDTYESIREFLNSSYEIQATPPQIRSVIERLAEVGFVEIMSDPFAGDLIVGNRDRFQSPYSIMEAGNLLGLWTAATRGGKPWFYRVFRNEQYWSSFDEHLAHTGEQASQDIEFKSFAPASDRLVTLNHNQIQEVDEEISAVIDAVEKENVIGETTGIRELILGKIRAGRELWRAGVFSMQSLYLTLVVGLQMLIDKHKDAAVSVAAAKLLDLLLKEHGIG